MALNQHFLYGHVNDDGSLELMVGELDASMGPNDHLIAGLEWNPQEGNLIERWALKELNHVIQNQVDNAETNPVGQAVVQGIVATFKTPAGTPPGSTEPLAGAIVQGRTAASAATSPTAPTSKDLAPVAAATALVKTEDLVAAKANDPLAVPAATVPAPGDTQNAVEGQNANDGKPAGDSKPAPVEKASEPIKATTTK